MAIRTKSKFSNYIVDRTKLMFALGMEVLVVTLKEVLPKRTFLITVKSVFFSNILSMFIS